MLSVSTNIANGIIQSEHANHMTDNSHWSSNMTFVMLGFIILVITTILVLLWTLRGRSGAGKTN